jgi:hypothetical protein
MEVSSFCHSNNDISKCYEHGSEPLSSLRDLLASHEGLCSMELMIVQTVKYKPFPCGDRGIRIVPL